MKLAQHDGNKPQHNENKPQHNGNKSQHNEISTTQRKQATKLAQHNGNKPQHNETSRNTMETSHNTMKLAQHNKISSLCWTRVLCIVLWQFRYVVHCWATVHMTSEDLEYKHFSFIRELNISNHHWPLLYWVWLGYSAKIYLLWFTELIQLELIQVHFCSCTRFSKKEVVLQYVLT